MYAWNYEDVRIFETMAVKQVVNDTVISGTGLYGGNYDTPFTFQAQALQNGWYISIIASHGKRGEFQGSTFNLLLEVAAAVRRIL